MNGWQTGLAVWRTETPETKFRPAGLRAIRVGPRELATFQRKRPGDRREKNEVLFQEWRVTISREFTIDALTSWLVESMATDGEISIFRPLKTLEMDVVMSDGSGRRLSGLALQKWEIVIQSKRIVSEEIELVGLGAESLAEVIAGDPEEHAMYAATHCGMRIDLDSAATSADWPLPAFGGKTLAFGGQVIFERSLEACNLKRDGNAERHAASEWEITGQWLARLSPEQYEAMIDTAYGGLWLQIGTADRLNIGIPRVAAKVDRQDFIDADAEHRFDFQAMTEGGTLAYIQIPL